ncbi:MAG: FAD-dependent oxidoreductase, partial [Actinomycetota bacterium]
MVAIDPRYRSTYADASWTPYWLDRDARPPARPALEGEHTVDLAIVGAGFTGLWAALQALEDLPGREVMVLEGERVAFGASGRNGGFCEASLTHGLDNGLQRFPTEIERIEQEGRENLQGIARAIERYGIDCAWEPTGTLVVATEPHQVQWCRDAVPHLGAYGHEVAFLDREAVRGEVDSPRYIGGFWRKDGGACIDPARLAWGLAAAAQGLGARIHEHSTVTAIDDDGDALIVRTARGRVRARRVILGTNAYPPLAKKIQRYILPVYDYVLMTEPLGAERKAAIGWANRQGLADMTNQFHYYRLTADDRILWGGYD